MTFNDSRWEQERKARMGRVAKQKHRPVGSPSHMTGSAYTQGVCSCGWQTKRIEGVGQWPSAVSWQEFQRHLEEVGVHVPQEDNDRARDARAMMELGYQPSKRSIWDRLFGWVVPQP